MLSPYRVPAIVTPPRRPARVNVRARVHHLRRKLVVALYERKLDPSRCRRCNSLLWTWEGGSACTRCGRPPLNVTVYLPQIKGKPVPMRYLPNGDVIYELRC
jgi:hypothetical protein